ncbi:MAG TPA: hypothetical protein PLB62_04445 [Candidatus Sumerlaeota bacterium]|nr:hypothetical protein [Candidatus Sumerlaeota bacterium]
MNTYTSTCRRVKLDSPDTSFFRIFLICRVTLAAVLILTALFPCAEAEAQNTRIISRIADAGGTPSTSPAGNLRLRSSISGGPARVVSSPWSSAMQGFIHRPVLADYDFQSGRGDWSFIPDASIPEFPFTAPASDDTGGALSLRATDFNTFGFFQGPFEIPATPDTVMRFRFALEAYTDTPGLVPRIRLRASLSDFQEGPSLDILSTGEGEASPSRTPRYYDMFYTPSAIAAASGKRFQSAFDLVNLGAGDSTAVTVRMPHHYADRFPRNSLGGIELVRDFQFSTGNEGWAPQYLGGVPSPFDQPDYAWNSAAGSLDITVNNPHNNFGFWEAPPAGAGINVIPGKIYRATFYLTTTAADPRVLPKIRMRLFADNYQTAADVTLDARGNAEILPVPGAERTWEVWLIPSPAAQKIGLALDLIALDPPDETRIENGAVVRLTRCVVERMNIPRP